RITAAAERARLWTCRRIDDSVEDAATEHEGVKAPRPTINNATHLSRGVKDKRILIIRSPLQVLNVVKGNITHRAGIGIRHIPGTVGTRPSEGIAALPPFKDNAIGEQGAECGRV